MIITQTPLRISFFGGGTDLKEFYSQTAGAVLSTTIDKYLYVIVKERYDRKIVVSWTRKESVDSLDEIQHQLVRETLRLTGLGPGIEVVTVADIPSEGSGLGSSSTLTVGLLNAFWQHLGETQSAEVLARQAARIEMEVLNKPIGKQDHYAAALGDLRQMTFNSDGSVTTEKIRIEPQIRQQLDGNLLIFYTNRTRPADTILSRQAQATPKNMETLTRMREQVPQARALLEAGRLNEFGALLHEAWSLKKQLADGISDPSIDAFYSKARGAGAIGGKLLGAGGGGFLLLYCPMDEQDRLRHAMRSIGLPEMPFHLERAGTKAIFNIHRETWKTTVQDQ